VLKYNSSLITLNLRSNEIKDINILEVLKYNSSLIDLNLFDNPKYECIINIEI
jgi:hypothetical protein